MVITEGVNFFLRGDLRVRFRYGLVQDGHVVLFRVVRSKDSVRVFVEPNAEAQ